MLTPSIYTISPPYLLQLNQQAYPGGITPPFLPLSLPSGMPAPPTIPLGLHYNHLHNQQNSHSNNNKDDHDNQRVSNHHTVLLKVIIYALNEMNTWTHLFYSPFTMN